MMQSNASKGLAANGQHKRSVIREALTLYTFPKIVLDPIRPANENLYDAEYEHKKEVFGHKFVKDFIIRTGKETFTKEEVEAWFKPTPVPAGAY